MPLSDDEINRIALKNAEATAAVMEPILRRASRQAIRDVFWGDDPAGSSEHVPGGLVRRIRNCFRDRDAK